MNKHKQYLLYITSFTLVLVLVFHFFGDNFGKKLMSERIDRKDYLASLKNFRRNGCFLSNVGDTEILVLGDSHAYAGIDFNYLEEKGPGKVGSCAIGALFVDLTPGYLKQALKLNPKVKKTFFITSPRMFWDYQGKSKAVHEHEKFMAKLVPQGNLIYLIQTIFRKKTDGIYEFDSYNLKHHRAQLESLDETKIKKTLDQSRESHPSLKGWKRRFENKKIVDNMKETIEEICQIVDQAGVEMAVVHAPESPFLESYYSREDWDEYQSFLEKIGECGGQPILIKRASDYGLGNRHYVNRHLTNVPYDEILKGESISSLNLYDPDHMIPLGALLFTEHILNFYSGRNFISRSDHRQTDVPLPS